MLRGLVVILVFQFAGAALQKLLALPFPGAVLGMLLFFVYLLSTNGGYEPERFAASQLIKHLSLFYIPAGVGVMTYGALLKQQALPIIAALTVGTWIAFAVAARVAQTLMRRQDRRRGGQELHHD